VGDAGSGTGAFVASAGIAAARGVESRLEGLVLFVEILVFLFVVKIVEVFVKIVEIVVEILVVVLVIELLVEVLLFLSPELVRLSQ
jgi:hypothetical protein